MNRSRAILVSLIAITASCVGTDQRDVNIVPAPSTTEAGADAGAEVPDGVDEAAQDPAISECTASLTTEQKAGQLLMVLVPSPAAAQSLAAEGKISGYALIGAQGGDIAGQVAAVAAGSRLPVFASGDEEGGTVQRFRSMLGALPSAQALAADNDPAGAASIFGEYAAKLKALGLNMNFGPSIDVGSGSGLGSRSFGNDVETVSNYGIAVIGAVRAAGLIPVAKHWPGIGGGVVDPHDGESPVADISILRERDLIPFERAIADGIEAIMVSHAAIPGVTDGVPASLSREAVTGELREGMGFDGLIVTDSLGMGAIAVRFDNSTAAVVAIAAGADLALVSLPGSIAGAHAGLVAAINAGTIESSQINRSVDRVLRSKGVTGTCP